MGRGGCKVHIVEACACTYYYLEVLSCFKHFGVDLVAANNQSIGFGYGCKQLRFFGILFEKHELVACCLGLFANTLYGHGCKGFLSSY